MINVKGEILMTEPTKNYLELASAWLKLPGLDDGGAAELKELIDLAHEGNEEALAELSDRFYRDLEFGTGGMRGVIGEGRNRMNATTIRKASQGFAEYILESAKRRGVSRPKAVVAYDSRRFSDLFSFEAACVFAANGIEAMLFPTLSATPLLSWAVRHLEADAGVVVTASHNPKEYNGYKIYNETGCQCLPEEADMVIGKIESVDPVSGIKTVANSYDGDMTEQIMAISSSEPLLTLLSPEVEKKYTDEVLKARLRDIRADGISVVYTPLNGAGNVPVRRVLTSIGLGKLEVVKEQELPDPGFTTCPFPNPEKAEALRLGLELCGKRKAEGNPPDALIGTDPDSDRLGCAIFDGNEYVQISGDRIGILLFDYIVRSRKELGTMPKDPVFITTIVSSPLTQAIAQKNGIEARFCLTGFKYIGNEINKLEVERGNTDDFVFGYEESCGYLTQPHVRDKDAVNSAMILCELMAYYKAQGKTALDHLEEIFKEYGYYSEALVEFVRPGEKGMQEIATAMEIARSAVENDFGIKIKSRTDYLLDDTGIPVSDVVGYSFDNGSRVIFRPSGTEPKLKIYFSVKADSREKSEQQVEKLKNAVLDMFL